MTTFLEVQSETAGVPVVQYLLLLIKFNNIQYVSDSEMDIDIQ